MTGQERKRYDTIRRKWPERFVNPPGAAYEILLESSLVRAAEAEDEARMVARGLPILVRDAVRRPDGSLGNYCRTLPLVAQLGLRSSPCLTVKSFFYAISGMPPGLGI